MGRRTEVAYKAESPGKSAPHDKAQGSANRVNDAVVSRQRRDSRPYPGRSAGQGGQAAIPKSFIQ